MSVKNAMTSEFLHSAYGGESMAHMRYLLWGDLAEKEGFPHVAKLFRATSYAEQVHATNHFRAIGGETAGASVTSGAIFGPNKTADNLRGGIIGELHEVEQMYPVYLNTAEFQNEPEARRSFHFALEAEKQHATLFQMALDAVLAGKDVALESVHICPICGHTVLDGAPDHCPICGTGEEQYRVF